MEMLVSLGLFGLLSMLAFMTFTRTNNAVTKDAGSVSAGQSAQGALDIMLNDVREAGENLDLGLGVSGIEINNTTKEIIVRKNIAIASRTLIPRMPLCALANGLILINGATSGVPSGACAYYDQNSNNDDDNVERWRAYFTAQNNIPQAAILYRPAIAGTQTSLVAKVTVTSIQPRTGDGSTISPYQTWVTVLGNVPSGFTTSNGSVLVLVDERRYKLVGDQLMFAQGGQTDAQASVMAFNISNLSMSADLVNPTATVDTIALSGPWQRVKSITLTMTAGSANLFGKKTVQRTYTGTMFPRNVPSTQTNLIF